MSMLLETSSSYSLTLMDWKQPIKEDMKGRRCRIYSAISNLPNYMIGISRFQTSESHPIPIKEEEIEARLDSEQVPRPIFPPNLVRSS